MSPLPRRPAKLLEQLRYEPHSKDRLKGLLLEHAVGVADVGYEIGIAPRFDLEHLCFLQITVELHQAMVPSLHASGLNATYMADRIFDACWKRHFIHFAERFSESGVQMENQNAEERTRNTNQTKRTFQALTFNPGEMGITYDKDGFVKEVPLGSQAGAKGISTGDQIVKVRAKRFSRETVEEAEKSGSDYEITFSKAFPSAKYVADFCSCVTQELERIYGANNGIEKQPILDVPRMKEIQQDMLDHLFMKQPLLMQREQWAQLILRALTSPMVCDLDPQVDSPLQAYVEIDSARMYQYLFDHVIPYACGFCNISRAFRNFSRNFLPNLPLVLVCCLSSKFRRGCHAWGIFFKRGWRKTVRHMWLTMPLNRFAAKAILFLVWLFGPKIVFWNNAPREYVKDCNTVWGMIVAVVFNTQITTAEAHVLDTSPLWFWVYYMLDFWVQLADVIHFWRARTGFGSGNPGAVGTMDVSTVASFLHTSKKSDGVPRKTSDLEDGIRLRTESFLMLDNPYNPFKSSCSFPDSCCCCSCKCLGASDNMLAKFSLNPFKDRNFIRYICGEPRPGMWLLLELLGCAFNFCQGITANLMLGSFSVRFHQRFAVLFAISHALSAMVEQFYIMRRVDDEYKWMQYYEAHWMKKKLVFRMTKRNWFLKFAAASTAYASMLSTLVIVVLFKNITSDPGGEQSSWNKGIAVVELILSMSIVAQNIVRFFSELRHTRLERIVIDTSKAHTFKGEMGIKCDEEGVVQEVFDNELAHEKGITEGDRIVKIGTKDFSKDVLEIAEKRGTPYTVTVSQLDPCLRRSQQFRTDSAPRPR